MPITFPELQRLQNIVDRSSYVKMAIQLGRDAANPYNPYELYPDSLFTNGGITREELHTELAKLSRGKQLVGTLPSFVVTWADPSILTSHSPDQVIQLRESGMFQQKGYLFFCLGADNPTKNKTQVVDPARMTGFYKLAMADLFSELGRMVGDKTLVTNIDRITVQWLAYSSSDLQTTASETIAAALEDMRQRIAEINQALAPYALQSSLDELTARVQRLEMGIATTEAPNLHQFEPKFSLFIDCGRVGNPILKGGRYWIGDSFYSGGNFGDNGVGDTANTDIPEIFQSERYGASVYTIPVPPGSYTVSLYFAENYYNQVSERVFNVSLQGTVVLYDFDILKEAGKSRALVKTFSGIRSTGQIIIQIFDPGTIMGISLAQES